MRCSHFRDGAYPNSGLRCKSEGQVKYRASAFFGGATPAARQKGESLARRARSHRGRRIGVSAWGVSASNSPLQFFASLNVFRESLSQPERDAHTPTHRHASSVTSVRALLLFGATVPDAVRSDPGAAVRVTQSRCEKGPEPVGESGSVRSHCTGTRPRNRSLTTKPDNLLFYVL